MVLESDLALPVDPRQKKGYLFHDTAFRKMLVPTLRVVFHLISRTEVSGVENLPAEGPVVLASNHLSNFDVFPIQLALPRSIFFMGKAELFQNPALDMVLRSLGGFPVYRGAHDGWAMNHAVQILERGLLLGIFPEGKRNKGWGLKPGKTGAARLAIDMDCPVVPLGIDGTQRMFRGLPRRTHLSIRVGQPILPRPGIPPQELTEQIMLAIASLLPAEMRGVYADHPSRS